MRSAAAAAKGASVEVNTQSDARKYNAPAALVPEIARSVAPAPNISSGIASGSTIKDKSTLPRRRPTVRPAPMAPSQLSVSVPNANPSSMVANAETGMLSPIATTGDTSTSAAPLTSQCANVLAMTIVAKLCPDSANCSKVPSSASFLNSESNDSSDDSSAATHQTPGAMSRNSDNCTLKPSGNSVVTIKKNTSGCSSCSGRLKLRHSSR